MPPKRPKRPHSFGGCGSCRRRHLKCDKQAPTCDRCRRSGLTCDFAPSIRWLVSTGPDAFDQDETPTEKSDASYTKRHLYTENSRISMSNTLLREIPRTVSEALDEIDGSFDPSDRIPANHAVGPFRVFDAGASASYADQAATLEPPTSFTSTDFIGNVQGVAKHCPASPSRLDTQDLGHVDSSSIGTDWPDSFDDLLTSSLDSVQWGDLFQWDFDMPKQDMNVQNMADDDHAQDKQHSGPQNSRLEEPQSLQQNREVCTTDAESESSLWPQLDLVGQAPLLLKHYNEVVISQMGSLPVNKKSAWRILNFPSAVFTLSELTTLAVDRCDIKHANLANFYAVISASALHLSLSPEDVQDWKNLSQFTYNAAKQHLRLSLEKECTLPQKAKYKDQLMAIGAILATALLSGNHEDGRKYLIQMERLIRYRGLVKPVISRRARLLHNVYAWMRIISESTNVLHELNQAADLPAFPAPQTFVNSGQETYISKSSHVHDISHDMTLDSFLYLEPLQVQPAPAHCTPQATSEGQLDLHLTSPFVERDGMCMQIYGVPETWLRLVSQTTRLANALDRLDPGANKQDAETFAMVQPKASNLENAVCAFRSRFQSTGDQHDATPHTHMVRALSGALVVFFYRRIRGIQPLMLQESVNQVIDSLHAFDQALHDHGLPGPGTAWPAFIAGAEAMSREQRQAIREWLQKAQSKSGWKGYGLSMRVLVELWKCRDVADGSVKLPTWMDVCRDLRCWPLLC